MTTLTKPQSLTGTCGRCQRSHVHHSQLRLASINGRRNDPVLVCSDCRQIHDINHLRIHEAGGNLPVRLVGRVDDYSIGGKQMLPQDAERFGFDGNNWTHSFYWNAFQPFLWIAIGLAIIALIIAQLKGIH